KKGAPVTLGVSYHRNPEHGGSHGLSKTADASGPPARWGRPPRLTGGYHAMPAGTILFAVAAHGGNEMVSAAVVLARPAHGLECRADPAGPLRPQPAGAARALSQVAAGKELHRLATGAVTLVAVAAASLDPAAAATTAAGGGALLAAAGLVRVCRRR